MHSHSKYHWDALTHLCAYLAQTRDHGMYLKRSTSWQVGKSICIAIADAGELANSKSNSRSIIGNVLFVEGNIAAFRSKHTTGVTTDASHCELIALYNATKLIKSIENLFISMHPVLLSLPITLYGDNLASLWISRSKSNSTRTKHYNLKLHYIYEQITNETIVTKHIGTVDCLADFLTKIQTPALFNTHRSYFVAENILELKEFIPPTIDKSDIS